MFLISKHWLAVVSAGLMCSVAATLLFISFVQREPTLGGNFSLRHRGAPWSFVDHGKNLNILYIGYTKCPDVCPFALASTSQAYRELSDADQKKVQVVFISVDFENDTDDSVHEYATAFNPSFVGLTGNAGEISKAVQLFGASFIKENNEKSYLGYTISHTDRLFFINSRGKIIYVLPNPRDSELIKTKIKEML